MRIFLSRHGQTDWNAKGIWQGVTDTPLNEIGLEQARRLAESMLDSGIRRVYTSELSRARITGQTVADRLGIPCQTLPNIHEINLGNWQGMTWEQIQQKWPELSARWEENRFDTAPDGGETYRQVLDRFVQAILQILRGEDEDVLIVSHGGCLYALQCALDDVLMLHNDDVIPNAEAFELPIDRFLRKWPLEESR